MQLAHAGDLGLAGLLVGLDAERRVLLGQAAQRDRHLLLVGLRLGLDGDLDDRLGEVDVLELIGASGAHSVSPVTICLMPTPAAMSPA